MSNISNGFSINGDLSFETVPQWWNALQNHMKGESLHLDLTQISRADSAGLAMLVSVLGQAQKNHCTLQFQGAPAQLRQLARVSGVDHLLPFVGA
jgi:phospholipid transport system transporter-binding protein